MHINEITAKDLRRMEKKEGLILQGCGGDIAEWVEGINEIFTQAGILKGDAKFESVSAFQYGELPCLLYSFEDVDLDMGKLAVWRVQTHDIFGGTCLSDFVSNSLGGFIGEPIPEQEKPDCALIGQNGNIYNLMGIAAGTLREHGRPEQATEMIERITASGSYEKALCIIGEYVNITDSERDFVREKENYLRNAELYEEGQTGNYNMLDGRLNNEPPERPDLTDGQTHEEIRELLPENQGEEKPSLLERLKTDRPEHEAKMTELSAQERAR